MKKLTPAGLSGSLALLLLTLSAGSLHAQEAPKLVFSNGRGVAVDAIGVEGGKLVVKKDSDGAVTGQSFPMSAVTHVSGEKPAAINKATALVLMDRPEEALKLLEPVLASQKASATFQGNYWVEAARVALIANTLYNEPAKAEALGKEISDATPAQGNDPSIRLGLALAAPKTAKLEDRTGRLSDLISDASPADISAFASYFRGSILQKNKKDDDAFQAFLSVGCIYPTGGMVLTSASELKAAEILAARNRRDEAVALLNSAIRGAKGTVVGDEAAKRLESLK